MTQTQELSGHVHGIKSATTREEVGRVYEQMVGYDGAADDESASLEDLRELALGYAREVCAAECIDPASVGL